MDWDKRQALTRETCGTAWGETGQSRFGVAIGPCGEDVKEGRILECRESVLRFLMREAFQRTGPPIWTGFSECAFELRDPDVISERVANAHVDAVGLVDRFLSKLNALAEQFLIRLSAVAGGEPDCES